MNRSSRITLGVIAISTLVLQTAGAQKPAAPPAGGGGGTPGGSIPGRGTPGGTTGRTTQPPTTDRFPNDRNNRPFEELQNRPIFLSGRVQLSDGMPASSSIVIERICNGVARAEAYTDSKGRFSFQLGQNFGVMQDASVSSSSDFGSGLEGPNTPNRPGMPQGNFGSQRGGGGLGRDALMGCEIRASLPGYRSDVVNLAGRRSLDHPEVGTIILHRLANVEGTTISATSLAAPKDARKAYEKGQEAIKKDKFPDAQKHFEKAVELYPQHASAWFDLGRLHEQQNNIAEARKCYAQALAADAKFVNPYLQLAGLETREQKWQDLAATTSRIIKLDPVDFPQAYLFHSLANYNLGKFDDAEASAREAQKLDTGHRFPKVDHLLGTILYEKKDYAGAAEGMRNYLKFAPNAQDADRVRTQLAELEKLTGEAKATQPQQ